MTVSQQPGADLWRTGTKVGRTIYRDGQLVGLMDTPELAQQVVDALNGGAELERQRDEARKAYTDEEYAHSNTIEDRDDAQDAADRLTAAIAQFLGRDFGEHSNLNDPWQSAAEALKAAPTAGQHAGQSGQGEETP